MFSGLRLSIEKLVNLFGDTTAPNSFSTLQLTSDLSIIIPFSTQSFMPVLQVWNCFWCWWCCLLLTIYRLIDLNNTVISFCVCLLSVVAKAEWVNIYLFIFYFYLSERKRYRPRNIAFISFRFKATGKTNLAASCQSPPHIVVYLCHLCHVNATYCVCTNQYAAQKQEGVRTALRHLPAAAWRPGEMQQIRLLGFIRWRHRLHAASWFEPRICRLLLLFLGCNVNYERRMSFLR